MRSISGSGFPWRDVSLRRYQSTRFGEMTLLQACRVVLAILTLIPFLLQGRSPGIQHRISKRMLPEDQSCDPSRGTCSKGDFVDKAIADCGYDKTLSTCTASGKTGGIISWVVAPDKDNRCKPGPNSFGQSCIR